MGRSYLSQIEFFESQKAYVEFRLIFLPLTFANLASSHLLCFALGFSSELVNSDSLEIVSAFPRIFRASSLPSFKPRDIQAVQRI